MNENMIVEFHSSPQAKRYAAFFNLSLHSKDAIFTVYKRAQEEDKSHRGLLKTQKLVAKSSTS